MKRHLGGKEPAISVDTKKKELIGDFNNGGEELRPKGDLEKVRVHDFPIPELGRARPLRDLRYIGLWRGKPLISLEVIVSLIAAIRTTTGLKVHSEVDTSTYPKGVKVSDKEIAQLNLHRDRFHGEWNYEIHPRNP